MILMTLIANRAAPALEILIVEDHPMMIRSITASLEALHPEGHMSGRIVTVGSLVQAKKRLLRRVQPGLVITDLNLPDSTGLDTLRALREAAPSIPIIVFSAIDDESTEHAALELGVQAFVSKSALPHRFAQKVGPILAELEARAESNGLTPVCRKAAGPQHPVALLTERQLAVLAEVAGGYSDREIALRLKIGEQTVRTHLASIFQRLGVQNRTQASIQYAAWAKA